jgi:hypothetical protein
VTGNVFVTRTGAAARALTKKAFAAHRMAVKQNSLLVVFAARDGKGRIRSGHFWFTNSLKNLIKRFSHFNLLSRQVYPLIR